MRNMKLVDAVIALHEIAQLVNAETEDQNLHDDIRNCAHRLHLYSIEEGHAGDVADEIIKQVKE